MKNTKINNDTFEVKGEDLLRKVKELIKEGNVRQITILNKEDQIIVVLPLLVGVAGAILLPPLAAVGAIAALVTECTIKVERR